MWNLGQSVLYADRDETRLVLLLSWVTCNFYLRFTDSIVSLETPELPFRIECLSQQCLQLFMTQIEFSLCAILITCLWQSYLRNCRRFYWVVNGGNQEVSPPPCFSYHDNILSVVKILCNVQRPCCTSKPFFLVVAFYRGWNVNCVVPFLPFFSSRERKIILAWKCGEKKWRLRCQKFISLGENFCG